MSWTAYDDPEVARKMTGLALGELGRWIAGDHEFHEPWKVFVRFMDHIRTPGYNASRSFLDVGCAAGYYGAVLRSVHGNFWNYEGVERSAWLRELAYQVFGIRPDQSISEAMDKPWKNDIDEDGCIQRVKWAVVLSGSVLQHEEHWQPFLKEHIAVCDHWLIIHKIPIVPRLEITNATSHLRHKSAREFLDSTTVEHHTKTAYGVEMDEWHFPVQVINDAIGKAPVMEHYFPSNPPHWSGLYDLSTP